MIKTKNLVPEVYYNRSRDFQLLGRTYDVIFNYMKMNADLIENNPWSDDVDDSLIPLLCSTLGFRETHEYNTAQMKGLCSIFVKCLRHKGTLASIQDLLNLLVNVENENDEAYAEVDINNSYLLNIYMPLSISDTSLFEDMLKYILPAGMSYRLVREIRIKKSVEDVVYLESDLVGPESKVAIQAVKGDERYASQLYDRPEQGKPAPDSIEESTDIEAGRLEEMTIVKITKEDQDSDWIEEGMEDLPRKANDDTEEEGE